jgi:hypothetical protein
VRFPPATRLEKSYAAPVSGTTVLAAATLRECHKVAIVTVAALAEAYGVPSDFFLFEMQF